MKGQAHAHQIHKTQILKLLSIAGVLEIQQVRRMVDIKPDNFDTVLTQLHRAGKIIRKGDKIAIDETALANYSQSTVDAMTVFADFIGRCDYYTAGEFPTVVCFFTDGAEYEIIPVEQGNETIVNKAVSQVEKPPLRIIVINDREQISKLKIPGIAAYCIVGDDGKVQYYKAK